jgi:hypothetical protein
VQGDLQITDRWRTTSAPLIKASIVISQQTVRKLTHKSALFGTKPPGHLVPYETAPGLTSPGGFGAPDLSAEPLHVCVWIHTFVCDAARIRPGRGQKPWCDPCLEQEA